MSKNKEMSTSCILSEDLSNHSSSSTSSSEVGSFYSAEEYSITSSGGSSLETTRLEDLNIMPVAQDLFDTDTRQLLPNIINKPYPDLMTYIRTHFHLLLEDVMQPFKAAIANLLKNANQHNAGVRLYANVKFGKGGLMFSDRAIPDCESAWRCYRIRFHPPSNVNWARSKRLIHGSLVCLWDGENEFITGVTTYSSPDVLANGKVTVAIATRELAKNYLDKTYLMIESVIFFEPYRAVLEALRSFTPKNFPFMDYVLGHVTRVRPPVYLMKNSSPLTLQNAFGTQDLSVPRPLDYDSWPSHQQLGLDAKQHQSFIAALTSRVSLVQGPPGTGKTFLALQIIKTLLANASLWQPNFSSNQKYRELSASARRPFLKGIGNSPRYVNKVIWNQIGPKWNDPRAPILVVCLTNHALDQFLEGVLKWTDKIVRVGGQSKSEVMKQYNLLEVKKRANIQTSLFECKESNYPYHFSNMQLLRSSMRSKIEAIRYETRLLMKEIPSVLDLKERGVIQESIARFFEKETRRKRKKKRTNNEDSLKCWLGWDNHNLLRNVARDMKLDLCKLLRERRAEKARNEVKIRKLTENSDRVFSDDDLSDVVDDVTDDDFDFEDDIAMKIEFGYQQSIASSKDEPAAIVEDLIDDSDFRDFKLTALDQLDEIRNFLCNQPLLHGSYMYYQVGDMEHMPVKQRWQLFSNWRRCYRDSVRDSLNKHEDAYIRHVIDYKEKKGESLAALCRGASVVGMTTTGAAKNRKMLEALRAKIVVVEEAAEVLESHVICSLTNDCQQLIMIGDHQQLRPSVNVHELEKKYNLDVSLFERLINIGIEPNVLGVQHRMRPEIARLITPAIYKDLKNAPTVLNRPNVPGMLHSVFFYHHKNQETRDEKSYFNLHEVDMALGLAAHLVRQKIPQQNITILATYTSQMHLIQVVRRRKFDWLPNVRITVVDNFQGEENEIVILSLVRNNNRPSIGFLATPNRICVGLSRARCGFYILGNMELLSKGSSLWTQIKKTLSASNQIGPAFPITCVRHEDSVIMAAKLEDLPKKAFCTLKCVFEMTCGHPCRLPCHEGDLHAQPCSHAVNVVLPCGHERALRNPIQVPCHLRQECRELVLKLLLCGHVVRSPCSDSFKPETCPVDVAIRLKCSHTKLIPCGALLGNPKFKWETHCKEMMSKELPCGHTKRMECRRDPSSVDCGHLIERVGVCGHTTRYRCQGKSRDDLDVLPCEELVKVTLPCGHSQKGPCYRTPGPCHEKVERRLDCGHEVQVKCCEKSPRCEVQVVKKLDCKHELLLACHVDVKSVQCDAIANVKRPSCSHLAQAKCHSRNHSRYLNSIACLTMMRKTLSCGHVAVYQCSMQGEIRCSSVGLKTLFCGHCVELPCDKDPAEVVCSEFVLVNLPCGHSTKRLCRENMSKKPVYVKCFGLVLKKLPCGHSQKMPCFKQPGAEICTNSVEITLPCGHRSESVCGTKATSKCTASPLATLPCGHDYPIPCGSSLDDVKCDAGVIVTLKCGHDATVPCSQLGEEHECVAIASKKLSCGHCQKMPCYKSPGKQVCRKCFAPALEQAKLSTIAMKSGSMIRAALPCGHFKEIPIYRNPETEVCLEPLHFTLNCGHRQMIHCSEAEDKENLKCEKLVKRRLPCGHIVKTKCSASDLITCNEMCEQRLGCGHTVKVKCSVPLEQRLKIQCGNKLIRQLACRHKVLVACGSLDAEKPWKAHYCREKIKKQVPGCGHEIETECGKNITRKDCKSRCNKRLQCGHQCKLPCCEECNSVQCDELIDLPMSRLSCGHTVKGPCQLRYAEKAELEAFVKKYNQCAAICGVNLDCGHECPGRCSDCTSSHSHAVCNAPCMRTLVCGHDCDALCYVACPPCNKKCAYQCVHGWCPRKCCEDCLPCKKPCAWMCPHFKCSRLCSELCNRKPCNKQCTKKLGCGHNCIALCGELCPPKCPSCSGVTVHFRKGDRYVYLECGHWIEVKEMDSWIYDQKDDEDGSKLFRLPCCPKCKKPVLICFRYGDVVKICYYDLPSLKFEYVIDVPVYESSIIKSLKGFLGDGHLSSVHTPLEQFIKEAEQLKQRKNVPLDQLWDAVNRSSLMYEWLCLLSDIKRTYTAVVGSKKYEFQLEDSEQLFEIGTQVMKKVVESCACGSEFCLNLSDLASRLDLLRQILVVQTASTKFNIYSSRELKQAIAISKNWQEFDEADFEFLEPWLDSVSKKSKLKLKSSVLESNEFFPRLSMAQNLWKKCLNQNCVAFFSSLRHDKCPSC